MLAIASSSEIPTFVTGQDSVHPLFDAQMTREIFASIDSATRPDSESLLLTLPAAVILMLNTEGSGPPLLNARLLLSPTPCRSPAPGACVPLCRSSLPTVPSLPTHLWMKCLALSWWLEERPSG